MRFSVEPWDPAYAPPADVEGPDEVTEPVNVEAEVARDGWAPIAPPPEAPEPGAILFVDGVQRVDARVWIECADGTTRPGICASWAAGVVRCDGRARIERAAVRRGVFSTAADAEAIRAPSGTYEPLAAAGDGAEALSRALHQQMVDLEVSVAQEAGIADLMIVDGPLRGRQNIRGAIGYVKTHHTRYLPPDAEGILGRLAAGERTPLFFVTTSWSRYSWYLRLPGPGTHAWAGIARLEAAAGLGVRAARALADSAAAVLPRFASAAHRDARAPQNLYPIAGLERELRHRLGDPGLLQRALRAAAGRAPGGTPAR